MIVGGLELEIGEWENGRGMGSGGGCVCGCGEEEGEEEEEGGDYVHQIVSRKSHIYRESTVAEGWEVTYISLLFPVPNQAMPRNPQLKTFPCQKKRIHNVEYSKIEVAVYVLLRGYNINHRPCSLTVAYKDNTIINVRSAK